MIYIKYLIIRIKLNNYKKRTHIVIVYIKMNVKQNINVLLSEVNLVRLNKPEEIFHKQMKTLTKQVGIQLIMKFNYYLHN